MADALRREEAGVSRRLLAQAWEFDFFQAVRLLERMAWEEALASGRPPRAGVGEDGKAADEVVRFRVPATSAFPSAAISGLSVVDSFSGGLGNRPAEMQVSFLGLIGPSGVLPQHYTSEAIARSQNQDHALVEFLNILQHRAISLFYRAWRKYRLPIELERRLLAAAIDRHRASREEELFAFCIRALVGLATGGLADRMSAADETVLYYAGHYSRRCRSAVALESLLADHFRLPVNVEQFTGRWINLPPDQRSAMPSPQQPRGQHCALGRTAVVGSRVWDVQTLFGVRIGPMSYRQFTQFLPGGPLLAELGDLVRLYAGPELDFVVQPVLRRDEVPTAQLGSPSGSQTMLGRNGWLASRPRSRDADEAVFGAA